MRLGFGIALVIIVLVVLMPAQTGGDHPRPRSCSSESLSRDGWLIAKRPRADQVITVGCVYIEPSPARPRQVYDAVVKSICPQRSPRSNICLGAFFLSGDAIPSSGTIEMNGTNPLAVWWENETSQVDGFTTWDCNRGPVEEAPFSALCGRSVREAYSAVLTLTSREGIAGSSAWPPRKTGQAELAKIQTWADTPSRAAIFGEAFDEGVATGRMTSAPQNPSYDCRGYLAKVESFVSEDMAKWKLAAGKQVQPIPARTARAPSALPEADLFDRFPVAGVYRGPLIMPDFEDRDRRFKAFRTRIRNGIKEGPNFAGRYKIIQFGCGTGCSFVMVADVSTGRVYGFPHGGEYDQGLQLEYRVSSNLIRARWIPNPENIDKCLQEDFLMKDGKFLSLGKPSLMACYTNCDNGVCK